MPRQNRVNPFGELIATSSRGTLMGNRGCLHDAEGQIKRLYAKDAWIFCQLHPAGSSSKEKRPIMSPGKYTELFFLDEATAFAAGHRPCNQCLRCRLEEFRQCWEQGNPEHLPKEGRITVSRIDEVLHQERLNADLHSKQMNKEWLSEVPVGCFVVLEQEDPQPYLVTKHSLIPWSAESYSQWVEQPKRKKVWVLTPPSIMKAIAAGFQPNVHPSILECV